MNWIIFALTLGASITSIIHGVFMLFGSLSVIGIPIPGIPSTMLASLPVISAVFALIGGVIAFNQSKWGALFLLLGTALCVPVRDTYIYGGLYFFAALLCFFLKPKQSDEFEDMIYSDYEDEENTQYPEPGENDFYYEQDIQEPMLAPSVNDSLRTPQPVPVIGEDIQPNNEPPKIRYRTSKICPECGATVARENRYCPTCGAKLFVVPDISGPSHALSEEPELQETTDPLLEPVALQNDFVTENEEEPVPVHEVNFNLNDGDDMSSNTQAVPSFRVLTKPRRVSQEFQPSPKRKTRTGTSDAASSYQEFSKYTKRGKKRKRSAGRKVLSMMLLVAAVGGAIYFLLGLRKLPPADLPSIVRKDLPPVTTVTNQNIPPVPAGETIATAVDVAIAENILPNFTPSRTPSNGTITGNSVNMRADHSTASRAVTKLSNGTRLEILDSFNVPTGSTAGIWYNVRTNNNREGWVYSRYVQPLGSGLPAGYSNALLKSFGSTKSQLVDALGTPTRSTSSSAEWPGLTATLRGEDITRIRLNSSNRELQNGLKVGMSQTALNQIMGYPSSISGRTLNYNENGKTGLSVQLDTRNSITSITVNELQ